MFPNGIVLDGIFQPYIPIKDARIYGNFDFDKEIIKKKQSKQYEFSIYIKSWPIIITTHTFQIKFKKTLFAAEIKKIAQNRLARKRLDLYGNHI